MADTPASIRHLRDGILAVVPSLSKRTPQPITGSRGVFEPIYRSLVAFYCRRNATQSSLLFAKAGDSIDNFLHFSIRNSQGLLLSVPGLYIGLPFPRPPPCHLLNRVVHYVKSGASQGRELEVFIDCNSEYNPGLQGFHRLRRGQLDQVL